MVPLEAVTSHAGVATSRRVNVQDGHWLAFVTCDTHLVRNRLMRPDAEGHVPTDRAMKQDERYRVLAQSAPDAIITIDEENVILSVNPATERIFGWAADELVGKRMSVLMPDRLRAQHAAGMTRYLESGERHLDWRGIALPGLKKDGTEFPMEVSFGEFVDGGRHIFSGFMRDVSDRVEQQQRIDRATSDLQRALESLEHRVQEAGEARQAADDANAAKGQFLRMMSHELRTPLNAIGGYVDLLEAGLRGPVTPAQRDDLVRIRSAQSRLLSLINDVLNFAKLEQGPIPVEIRTMPVSGLLDSLEGMIAPQLRSREIRFKCQCRFADRWLIASESMRLAVACTLIFTSRRNSRRRSSRLSASCTRTAPTDRYQIQWS